MNRRPQRGWGLTETLLTLGAMSAMALAIYAVLGPASASAQVKQEQDNLRSLSGAIDRSFGLLGNFSSVSTARVMEDGLAPTRMRSGGDLRTAWGTGVGIHPYAVDGTPGNAFLVSYPLAPSAVCAGLASAMSRDAYDIRVEGRSVYAGGRLDPAIAAEQCGATAKASMEFVFFSGLVSGQAVAAAPVVLPPPPPTITPPPGTPPIITIPGTPEVDPVNPGTPAVPPPAAPPPVLPPPVAPPGTPPGIAPPPPTFNPPPPPVSPPGAMCAPRTDNLGPQTRTLSCPAGQLGAVNQQRTGTLAWTCPEAWGAPVRGTEVWGSWTETGRTCAPACVAPAPSTESQTLACPSGQLGAITQQRTTSWTCPAATGSPTSTTSPWTTVSNTCAAACVAPAPQTDIQTRDNTRELGCPSGQEGAITQTRPERRTRTRTASCPAPTGSFTWGEWSAWEAWEGTGSWTETGRTCAPVAPTCAAPVGAPGGPVLMTTAVCSENWGDNGTAPDWGWLKANTPESGTRSFYGHQATGAGGGWNCMVSRGSGAWREPQVNGNRNTQLGNTGRTFVELEWGGQIWSARTTIHTTNFSSCTLRGSQAQMGCGGMSGALPPGVMWIAIAHTPSTSRAQLGSYTCP